MSPFSSGGPDCGRNDLGFDLGSVMVSLRQPGMYFVLPCCEGCHLTPVSFPCVAPYLVGIK